MPYTSVNEPKNRARTSAARRGHTPSRLRLAYARTPKKNASTATGFHSSSASHDDIPSAVSPPEMTTAGWK